MAKKRKKPKKKKKLKRRPRVDGWSKAGVGSKAKYTREADCSEVYRRGVSWFCLLDDRAVYRETGRVAYFQTAEGAMKWLDKNKPAARSGTRRTKKSTKSFAISYEPGEIRISGDKDGMVMSVEWKPDDEILISIRPAKAK